MKKWSKPAYHLASLAVPPGSIQSALKNYHCVQNNSKTQDLEFIDHGGLGVTHKCTRTTTDSSSMMQPSKISLTD